ncbi:hypothetical protein ABVQ20_36510 [Mesorhizobium shangrilense]|uniref:Uncharacterized protein n=1 Tax=Mesorhizobium shangrilense TaxID=460060 RepID=A0ABV2DR27_9HYPH
MIQLIAPFWHGDFADEPHVMYLYPTLSDHNEGPFPQTTDVREGPARRRTRAS